ncbi:hypothetical protein M951_chr3110 (nucleomorph) [Lotharella oceanica]|uniref:Uncharacterized protein n=1 Tax=Lotharella oceanica TaxID=641309 RepID=A0A060DGR7_9EUKA|nr:hypothetical protein M951_chr3110 [Lotharella oceanica]
MNIIIFKINLIKLLNLMINKKFHNVSLYLSQKYKINNINIFIVILISTYIYSINIIKYYTTTDKIYFSNIVLKNETIILKIFLTIKIIYILKLNIPNFVQFNSFLNYQKIAYSYIIFHKLLFEYPFRNTQ